MLDFFCLSVTLAGRGHEEEGMPATMLSTLQVINNLERD